MARTEVPAGTDIPGAIAPDSSIEVLFREARRRRRRRWTIGILVVLVAATVSALVLSRSAPPPRSTEPSQSGLPRWAAPSASHNALPDRFVSGDGDGGVGVYDTATGRLLFHLGVQTSGGPDQQAVLADDGKTVYFAQPDGTCSGTIEAVPVSGATKATPVIDDPGTLALEPEPSPTSSELAWVGVACGRTGAHPTVYVTHMGTGAASTLGPYAGQVGDDGLSWSDDGTLLAVETAPTVKIVPVDDASRTGGTGRQLVVPLGCRLLDPAFVPTRHQIAVVRTCASSPGRERSSAVLVYDWATGRPVATVVTAPSGTTFESLSVDAAGHVLVGLVAPRGSAETALAVNGRLVTISTATPTGAQW